MAMSRSLPKGQFPVPCNLCDIETKISWKCVDCDLLMCNKCKKVIHPRIKNAKTHKVIDIKEIGSEHVGPDFSSIPCTEHKGQICVMFCKSCDQLVCPQCIAKIHNGHGLVEIHEVYQIQIQNLKDEQNETKVRIDHLAKEENRIKEIKKTENAKYTETKKKIQAQKILLTKAIVKYTEQLLKELDQRWETLMHSIGQEESRVAKSQKQSTDRSTHLDETINSGDAEQIFQLCKIKTAAREAEDSPEFNFNSMPNFLPGDITKYNVGSLQNIEDIEIRIKQKYTTDISEVFEMTSCADSLWIANNDLLQKVKPEIDNIKITSSFQIKSCGMALTSSNDLLLVSDGPVIRQISGSTGQLTDSIYRTEQLQPTAVHVTSEYKVLVGVKSFGNIFPVTGRKAVILMDNEGKHKTTYEYDRASQSIFSYVRKITSTSNGRIFVVDMLSTDDRGRVVVLEEDGNILNIYNGNPDKSTEVIQFKPVSIVTTPTDKIIIPDVYTHVLHFLNSEGHLITLINTRDIGITHPYSIAFTKTDKVYIGCTGDQSSTTMAKLYEVKISGI